MTGRVGMLQLGCPIWACEKWRGTLFAPKAKRSDWLAQYSSVFNTVEGNSTFYGLPALDTVRRWAQETADGFRFALKFPREISHERRLFGAESATEAFLEVLKTLHAADRLGPSFLQLPPDFSGKSFAALEAYLRRLPRDFPYAVELRHANYYDQGHGEQSVDALLTELGIDRVLFDSRPLYSAPPKTESEQGAQSRKPQTPLRTTVTGPRPLLRLIGRDRVEEVEPFLQEWAPIVAGWLAEGRSPYVFTHAPDDAVAPFIARRFHEELLRAGASVWSMPRWPGETSSCNEIQGSLF
jgi:uncharacterized protein YecE (DUF72 family)